MLSLLLGWALYSGARQMGYEWQWPRVLPFLGEWDEGTFYAGPLLNGLLVTLQVALLSLLGTLAVGVCVVSLRLLPPGSAPGSPSPIWRWCAPRPSWCSFIFSISCWAPCWDWPPLPAPC